MERAVKTEEAIQFVAGFFDGDGCVSLVETAQRRVVRIVFTQSREDGQPPELVFVAELYGGKLWEGKKPTKGRRVWRLILARSDEQHAFLRDMVRYSVVKRSQAEIALNHLDGRGDVHDKERMAALKKNYSDVVVDAAQLAEAYVAGLFTADGYVGVVPSKGRSGHVHYVLQSSITRHECHNMLRALQTKYASGRGIDQGKFLNTGHAALAFLERIRPYLISTKKAQVELAIGLYDLRTPKGKRRTDESLEAQKNMAEELKKLKRQ